MSLCKGSKASKPAPKHSTGQEKQGKSEAHKTQEKPHEEGLQAQEKSEANSKSALALPLQQRPQNQREEERELQAYRAQCAAGVRQAVEAIEALEDQLWVERSQRQRAEADVKVLLSAIHTERNLAADAVLDAAASAQLEADTEPPHRADQSDCLLLAASELPVASEAATSIQKHYRGHLARKRFEERLYNVLRGIDPALSPSHMPPHAMNLLQRASPHHLVRPQGLGRTQQQQAQMLQQQQWQQQAQQPHMVLHPPGMDPQEQHVSDLRAEVQRIEQQQQQQQLAGVQGTSIAPDQLSLDVDKILSGSTPAGLASCVAALVRRCKELQAALLCAAQDLHEARMSQEGLRQQNAKVAELSQVRAALENERQDNFQLKQALSQLRFAAAEHNQQRRTTDQQGSRSSGGTHAGPRALGQRKTFDSPEEQISQWENTGTHSPV